MKTRYPNVYQDKNGKYFYQIFIGTNSEGKKRLKKGRRDAIGRPFSSARQAYQEVKRVQALYSNVSADNITYSSFMKDKYLLKYHGDVEESTYQTHRLMMMKGVDYLRDIKLKDIKVLDCEKYRTWLLTDSDFSRNYASVIYTAFRQSLDYAVEIGLLAANPSLKTKSIPKGRTVEKYWAKPEFEKVLATINIDSFYEQLIYVTLLFYYRIGCRVNEGFALRWSDIDLENGKVRFIDNLHYQSKLNYELIPYLKNDSSRRTVTIDAELLEVLRNWKKEQAKYNVYDFVLSYDNCPLNKSTLSVWLKRYSKLANIPRINGHGLRHSNASYLIAELGADVLTVSHRLGHKTPMTTLKYYAHMFSNNDIELASKIEGSMNIKLAQHSKVEFNGNQHISGNSISGMPKVCQKNNKPA